MSATADTASHAHRGRVAYRRRLGQRLQEHCCVAAAHHADRGRAGDNFQLTITGTADSAFHKRHGAPPKLRIPVSERRAGPGWVWYAGVRAAQVHLARCLLGRMWCNRWALRWVTHANTRTIDPTVAVGGLLSALLVATMSPA